MVLQILAHTRQVVDHGDGELPKPLPLPHARQFQQLRRLERARRQDHLAGAAFMALAPLPPDHANGALALEQDALNKGMGF